MRKWSMGAIGAVVASGIVAFGVITFGGAAQAQVPPDADNARARHESILAEKLGITVEKLQAAQKAARDQMVDELLAAGKINAEQAGAIKAGDAGKFRGLGGGFGAFGGHIRDGAKAIVGSIKDAILTVIPGIDEAALKDARQNGQSLAELAVAHGLDRDGLKSGLTNELRSDINAALAAGTIDQATADRLLTALDQRIDQLIDAKGGMGPQGLRPMRDGMRPMHDGTGPKADGLRGRFFQRGPLTQ